MHLIAAGALAATTASAQVVISDNFETDSSANYTVVNDGTPNGTQTFAFDYVAAGIPLAPRSTAGDVGGLKLTANDTDTAVDAWTLFHNVPVGALQYKLTVDVWMNFVGTAGTTEFANIGVGGDGATFNQYASPISGSGAFIAFTGDGGSGSDYRWFRDGANTPAGDMASTTLPNTHPSYLGHGSNNSGAFFQALFPSPPATIAGSPGNIWTTVEIVVDNANGMIAFYFDGQLTFQGEFANAFDGLVSLGIADTFTSVSPATNFTLYDNLEVEVLSTGIAPTPIFGVNLRLPGSFFTTNTSSFVSSFNAISPASPISAFALDFDNTAQTLYAIANSNLEIGTIDLTTGLYTTTGIFVTGVNNPLAGATGLTCTPNGTWYLTQTDAGSGGTSLYVGDITTGVFTLVGLIDPGTIIDIAADASGNLFGHDIVTDAFFSIDPTTGLGTSVALTGLAANFAQGMDFDWSTGLLYAAVYTSGGTGSFVSFDPATNAVTVLESTTALNAEMEIACRVPANIVNTDVCGAGVPNSTGKSALMQVAGSSVVADNALMLTVHYLPLSSTGFFINSPDAPFTVMNAGGAAGNLCIAGFSVGRHDMNILNSGTSGAVQLFVDLNSVPQPLGATAIQGSEQWSFQYWYRDTDPSGGATSNFSNARTVSFL
ncbi:MAG: hypothetical protein R3F49_13655 [Planctomycetota bacterium]